MPGRDAKSANTTTKQKAAKATGDVDLDTPIDLSENTILISERLWRGNGRAVEAAATILAKRQTSTVKSAEEVDRGQEAIKRVLHSIGRQLSLRPNQP